MRREDQNFKLCLGCRDFKTSMDNLMSPYLGKYKEVGVTLVAERSQQVVVGTDEKHTGQLIFLLG